MVHIKPCQAVVKKSKTESSKRRHEHETAKRTAYNRSRKSREPRIQRMKARSDVSMAISRGDNVYVEEGVVPIPRLREDLAKRVSDHVARVIRKSDDRHRYSQDSQTKPEAPRCSLPNFFVRRHSSVSFCEHNTHFVFVNFLPVSRGAQL